MTHLYYYVTKPLILLKKWYSVSHIITYPSKELCSKIALGEGGVSLPWWCHALVLQAPGYWGLFLNPIIFSWWKNDQFQRNFRSKLKDLNFYNFTLWNLTFFQVSTLTPLARADFEIKVKRIAHSIVHFDQWNKLIFEDAEVAEVAEVKRPRNSKRWKFYYKKWWKLDDFEILASVTSKMTSKPQQPQRPQWAIDCLIWKTIIC